MRCLKLGLEFGGLKLDTRRDWVETAVDNGKIGLIRIKTFDFVDVDGEDEQVAGLEIFEFQNQFGRTVLDNCIHTCVGIRGNELFNLETETMVCTIAAVGCIEKVIAKIESWSALIAVNHETRENGACRSASETDLKRIAVLIASRVLFDVDAADPNRRGRQEFSRLKGF